MICSYCIDDISIHDCAVSINGKWFHAKRAPSEECSGETSSCWESSEFGTKALYRSETPCSVARLVLH
jgi:hypothetical protein